MNKMLKCGAALVAASIMSVNAFAGELEKGVPFRLGIAGYTYHKQSIDSTLEQMKALDLHWLCVKDFHLSLKATDDEIEAFKDKLAKYDVKPTGIGPIYMSTKEQADNAFSFARRLGVKLIVGVPFRNDETKKSGDKRVENHELIKYISGLCDKYDIRYAIHNHGPDMPALFPTGESSFNAVKAYSKNIGMCLDIGHDFRDGRDPALSIRKYASRIFDVHLKNVSEPTKKGHAMVFSRGAMDLDACVKALKDVNYTGVCSIEYETNFTDNFADMQENVRYFRGIEAPNTLSDAEKADGWKLLWDGADNMDFVGVKNGCKEFPKTGWVRKDGVLTIYPVKGTEAKPWTVAPDPKVQAAAGGDIVTADKDYRDFEFSVDFRLTPAANSGIKYFIDEEINHGTSLEFQLLDKGHADWEKGRDGNRRIGALYDMIPASDVEDYMRPVGQWNTATLIVKDNLVEHRINGKTVLAYKRGGEAFTKAFLKSKYTDAKNFNINGEWGLTPAGRILLQDHTDSCVSFRNIKVRKF